MSARTSVDTHSVKKMSATRRLPLRKVEIRLAICLTRASHTRRILKAFPLKSTNGPNQYMLVSHIGFRFRAMGIFSNKSKTPSAEINSGPLACPATNDYRKWRTGSQDYFEELRLS